MNAPKHKTKMESKTKKEDEIVNINNLEKVVLATALTVLRSRRKNYSAFTEHGIITNEALNDMNVLLKILQDKKQLNNEVAKQMSQQVKHAM